MLEFCLELENWNYANTRTPSLSERDVVAERAAMVGGVSNLASPLTTLEEMPLSVRMIC